MKLSVALFVWAFPVLSETFVINIATGLLERGHKVDIYALGGPQSPAAKMHPDVEHYGLMRHVFYPINAPQRYRARMFKGLGMLALQSYRRPRVVMRLLADLGNKYQLRSWSNIYSVVPLLGKGQYDVIHGQFGPNGLLATTFRQQAGLKAKVVTSFRGYEFGPYLKKYGAHVFDPLFKTGDLFLPNSDHFKRRLIEMGCPATKIHVFRSGVDCLKFAFREQSMPADGRIKVVTVGRLVGKKGVEYGIQAVAKLCPIFPNIEYAIIGEGYLRPMLEDLIKSLGVENNVKLLGAKHQTELIELLNQAHVMIAPSITADTGNQDGPINTLKEAMAVGLPVIGTRHGGIPELVEDGVSGYLVPERDVDALADRLHDLIMAPEKWSQMGRAGRIQVQAHYNLEYLNNELVGLYNRVLVQP